jgi:hypothetical protein
MYGKYMVLLVHIEFSDLTLKQGCSNGLSGLWLYNTVVSKPRTMYDLLDSQRGLEGGALLMENIKLKISIPKHCERDVYTPAHLKTTTRCYIYWSRYFVCRHPQYWLFSCCNVTSGLLAACTVALAPTVLRDLLWMNVMCWLLAFFFPTSVTWDALLWWLQCWLWETVRFFIIFILVISRFWGPRWHSG